MSSRATIPVLADRRDITFAAGTIDAIHGWILAGSPARLWGCAQMIPCSVVRIDPTNFASNTIAVCPADSQHDRGLDIVYDGNINDRIYVLHRNLDRTVISSFNPATMARADVVNDTADPNTNGSLAINSTHLFCGTNFGAVGDPGSPDAKVLKYALSGFAKTTLTLTGLKQCHALRYDGTHLYATGSASTDGRKWIAKINPTTMALVAFAYFPSGSGTPTDDFGFAGDYVYVGMELIDAGRIYKIAKSDLSMTEILIGVPVDFYGIFNDGVHLWALTRNTDMGRGRMVRIDPSTGEQRLYTYNTDEGADGPNELATDGTYLFVTLWQSGVKVSRFRIPST